MVPAPSRRVARKGESPQGRGLSSVTPVYGGRSGERRGLTPLAELVRRHDRDRFQTALFAPARHREALFALYAFNHEIARVPEIVSEPMLGQIRLQWWREAIDTAFAGGAPRNHPVVHAITAAIRERGLGRTAFDRLIDAREHDLGDEPPADLAALEAYVEGSAATLLFLALEILGVRDDRAHEAARHAGIAYGLAGILRAMPFKAGRPLFPPGVPIPAVAAVAEAHLAAARAWRGAVPRAALPALLPARIADAALRRLKRAGFEPLALAPDDPMQSWRLAFAALTGRF